LIRDFDKLPVLPTVFGPANQVAYVENDQGLILEIVEWNAMPRPYFDGIKDLHKACDKQQLVHAFKLADITPKIAVVVALLKYMLKKLFGRVQQTRRPV